METFDPKAFVETEIEEIRRKIGCEKALVAVSGGVDSSTCAVLTHKALGENLVCVVLDDAFMRKGEPERVAEMLSNSPLEVPTKAIDVRERFLQTMKGLRDAEQKRKIFRETFYQVLSETAKSEGCNFLVQGTIRADVVETVGGVKTQHNVLEPMGINPMEKYGFEVVEPLSTLFKEQVRMLARYLGLPPEISERQPFPGPGLSVRAIGEIRRDKLETLKDATEIVELELKKHTPSQYFAVIIDNEELEAQSKIFEIHEIAARYLNVPSRNVTVKIFKDKATGVERGKRRYGEILGVTAQTISGQVYQTTIQNLVSLQKKIITENPTITRVFYAIKDLSAENPYIVGIRAVETKDFLTAEVSEIPWTTLSSAAEKVLNECPNVAAVYYDVTPKPPATIEME